MRVGGAPDGADLVCHLAKRPYVLMRLQICEVSRQLGGERTLKFARFARFRHDAAVLRGDEFQYPVYRLPNVSATS
jgi:hypothetical protein